MGPARNGRGALICIPTYNEAQNLPLVIEGVRASVPAAQILVCDDGSPDGTGELADVLAREDAAVHVLHHAGKQGLARAYLAGFAWGLDRGFDALVQMDADLSHDPACLPAFLEALATVADVVVGSRRVPGGGIENWGPVRHLVSWGGSTYSRVLLGVKTRDLTSGYNAWRREVLEQIGLAQVASSGYCFQIELKYRALRRGFRVLELPIVFPNRVHGESKMDLPIFLEALLSVWKLRHLHIEPLAERRTA